MNCFLKPRGKRLGEYEILTVYSQPTPDWIAGGLDCGDWTQKFHGGRSSRGNELTELKSSDWHHQRDPGRSWHGPYVKDKSEDWRCATRLPEPFSADDAIRTLDPFWRDEILTSITEHCCRTNMRCSMDIHRCCAIA
jgi:methane monooxygenase component A beta chain